MCLGADSKTFYFVTFPYITNSFLLTPFLLFPFPNLAVPNSLTLITFYYSFQSLLPAESCTS